MIPETVETRRCFKIYNQHVFCVTTYYTLFKGCSNTMPQFKARSAELQFYIIDRDGCIIAKQLSGKVKTVYVRNLK